MYLLVSSHQFITQTTAKFFYWQILWHMKVRNIRILHEQLNVNEEMKPAAPIRGLEKARTDPYQRNFQWSHN